MFCKLNTANAMDIYKEKDLNSFLSGDQHPQNL